MQAELLHTVFNLLLRPVVRMALRHSVYLREVTDALKESLVQEASATLKSKGERVTESRVSVMTGVHRQEVKRLMAGKPAFGDWEPNMLSRIVDVWETDPRFLNAKGKPRSLFQNQEVKELSELIAEVTTAVNPATLLAELQSAGIVTLDRGRATLNKENREISIEEKGPAYEIISRDISDLFASAEEIIEFRPEYQNMHFRTELDGIDADNIDEIKQWLFHEGQAFHHKVRKYLAGFDRLTPLDTLHKEKKRTRVVVTSFSGNFSVEPD